MKLITSLIIAGILLIASVVCCCRLVNQKIYVEKQKTAIKCLTDNQNILLQITRDGICQRLNDIEQKQIKIDKNIVMSQVDLDKKINELILKQNINENLIGDVLKTNIDILQGNLCKKIDEVGKKQFADEKKAIDAMQVFICKKIEDAQQISKLDKTILDKNIIPGGEVLISTNKLGINKLNVWQVPSNNVPATGNFTMNYFCNLVIDSCSDGYYYYYTNGIISRINGSNVVHNSNLILSISP
jgi:hypothetical protein